MENPGPQRVELEEKLKFTAVEMTPIDLVQAEGFKASFLGLDGFRDGLGFTGSRRNPPLFGVPDMASFYVIPYIFFFFWGGGAAGRGPGRKVKGCTACS